MHQPPSAALVSNAQREQVTKLLSEAFAADRLPIEELDRRLALVYRAQSVQELEFLLIDPAQPGVSLADEHRLVASDAVIPDRGVSVAFMGGFSATGGWLVPRHLKVWAVMGGGDLDLREARFSPGVTVIEIVAFMGGVDLLLPPGVRLEVTGAGFLGAFAQEAGVPVEDPYAPVVRVSGTAIAGGVDIKRLARDRKSERRYVEALERAEQYKR